MAGTVTTSVRGELSGILHFRAIVDHDPYPWQRHFYGALIRGDVPDAVDIPTGLGKTFCVLLALLAGLANPSLPRRIVYIVDRRAIVDQTSQVIRGWIDRIAALPALARAFNARAAFPAEHPVGLGVLRGGLADDGAWRVDPARAAVIVGTVDMIGSRILFSGYGDGRSRRPMDAGLLGHDALVLLDEAHLAPALGELLRSIARIQNRPEFRPMTLSATGQPGGTVLGLTRADLNEPAVRRRLRARKSPHLLEAATPARRIDRICEAAFAHRTGAIIVFVESVADARQISARLVRALGPDGAGRVALLTGTLRGRERAALAGGAVWGRFDPERERTVDSPSVYLVSTAAGEVGVDLDADHAVMGLAPLDSMIQRLGRVNRAGAGDARVTIVFTEREAKPLGKAPTGRRERLDAARRGTLEVLRGLADLCPGALRGLDTDTVAACSAPSPEPARLDRVAVEAFAATSVALPLPPVAVYLRGVDDATDVPQCLLAWRSDVPDLVRLGPAVAGEVLAFYRLRPEELARVPAPFAEQLVRSATSRQGGAGLAVVVVRPNGEILARVLESEAAAPSCAWTTVILPPDAGGLTASGLPDAAADVPVADVAESGDRIRYVAPTSAGEALPAWTERAIELRFPISGDGGGQRWLVYALRRADAAVQGGEGASSRRGTSTQTVDAHCAGVGAAARRIGEALGLAPDLVDALEAAGAWHDRGKTRAVWQRAAGAPMDGAALAKSPDGRFRVHWLGGYRHEFGSLADAERALGPEFALRDLILHLVAAHHGWARPGFPAREQWDPEDLAVLNEARAVRTVERFARLQAEHGPWRLAWLEALVKSADAFVSSEAGV